MPALPPVLADTTHTNRQQPPARQPALSARLQYRQTRCMSLCPTNVTGIMRARCRLRWPSPRTSRRRRRHQPARPGTRHCTGAFRTIGHQARVLVLADTSCRVMGRHRQSWQHRWCRVAPGHLEANDHRTTCSPTLTCMTAASRGGHLNRRAPRRMQRLRRCSWLAPAAAAPDGRRATAW